VTGRGPVDCARALSGNPQLSLRLPRSPVKLVILVLVTTAIVTGCKAFHDIVGLARVVSDDTPPDPGNYSLPGTLVLYLMTPSTSLAIGQTEPLSDGIFIAPWTPYVRSVGSLADSTRHVVSSDSSVVTTDSTGLTVIAHAAGAATLTMTGRYNVFPMIALVTINVRPKN
jgi:hypothetical protein